jgi:hypothetical protein
MNVTLIDHLGHQPNLHPIDMWPFLHWNLKNAPFRKARHFGYRACVAFLFQSMFYQLYNTLPLHHLQSCSL